ncbi:hypothetical protein JCM19047_3193 [Bacillus sp. JCM 19047]|uniref:DUF309 domain-containing protein n=1 Tax=Shouchella miscanthi TaxID=2598861 RepID=UPI0003EFE9AB|nr:DUF309 domain-containing protein [Shouchella miscanthi]GAF23376.1 hypothetical protein JCM19047_3193 [Bacillus sp. JCM 19047]
MFVYPPHYIAFLTYFHVDRDYFECHEVLELEWKKQADPERLSPWVILIQIAVALYHERRGNEKGARILYNRVENRLKERCFQLEDLGMNEKQVQQDMHERYHSVGQTAFTDYELPIQDPALITIIQQAKRAKKPSTLTYEQLVHKHRYPFDEKEKRKKPN